MRIGLPSELIFLKASGSPDNAADFSQDAAVFLENAGFEDAAVFLEDAAVFSEDAGREDATGFQLTGVS